MSYNKIKWSCDTNLPLHVKPVCWSHHGQMMWSDCKIFCVTKQQTALQYTFPGTTFSILRIAPLIMLIVCLDSSCFDFLGCLRAKARSDQNGKNKHNTFMDIQKLYTFVLYTARTPSQAQRLIQISAWTINHPHNRANCTLSRELESV